MVDKSATLGGPVDWGVEGHLWVGWSVRYWG